MAASCHPVGIRLLQKKSSGFTLAELLGVIAIGAFLVALIIPAVNKALDTSRRARCLANLHSIGIAIQQYAVDNNGRIVNARVLPGGGGDYWPSILERAGLLPRPDSPRGTYKPIYMCPTTARMVDLQALQQPWSYRINSRLAVIEPFSVPQSFLSLSFPSKTSLLVDSPKLLGAAVPPWYSSPGDLLDAGIHNKNMNVLFCDGHVSGILPPKNGADWDITGPGGLFFTGKDQW